MKILRNTFNQEVLIEASRMPCEITFSVENGLFGHPDQNKKKLAFLNYPNFEGQNRLFSCFGYLGYHKIGYHSKG
jgi:hypothetical protein